MPKTVKVEAPASNKSDDESKGDAKETEESPPAPPPSSAPPGYMEAAPHHPGYPPHYYHHGAYAFPPHPAGFPFRGQHPGRAAYPQGASSHSPPAGFGPYGPTAVPHGQRVPQYVTPDPRSTSGAMVKTFASSSPPYQRRRPFPFGGGAEQARQLTTGTFIHFDLSWSRWILSVDWLSPKKARCHIVGCDVQIQKLLSAIMSRAQARLRSGTRSLVLCRQERIPFCHLHHVASLKARLDYGSTSSANSVV